MRSKIQTQAILLSIVPLAFLLTFLAVVLILNQRSTALSAWAGRATVILDRSDDIEKGVSLANQSAADFIAHPSAKALRLYKSREQSVRGQAHELGAVVATPEQRIAAVRYAGIVDRVFTILDTYLEYIRAGKPAEAKRYATSPQVRSLGLAFQMAKGTFDRSVRRVTNARSQAMRDEIVFYSRLLLIGTVLGIALTLLTTARFGIGIASRIRQLAVNARRLGLDQPTQPVTGNDEIADVDRIYHDMAQRMRETMSAYRREHYIASTLQRALLPQQLPKVDGLRVDTAYAVAAHSAEIGGDWYDVFQIDRNTVGISVGDVAGHGVRAATIMGSVRQMIRASARLQQDPATVLDRVNRVLCAEERDVLVTAFFAELDMRDGRMQYAVAGHPLPLVVHSGKLVEQLKGDGLILGVDPSAEFNAFEVQLREGEGIIGFTDGIVEIGRDYFAGMENLIATVKSEYADMPASNIAERIKDRILSGVEPVDDSAILFVGITSLGVSDTAQRKTWKVDVREQGAAYRLRRALLWELAARSADGSDLPAVELIIGELLSNVARHTPGEAIVTLDYRDGQAILKVEDRGEAFSGEGDAAADPLAPSGRGLHLIRTLARSIAFESNGKGNSVAVVLPVTLSQAA